MAMIKVRAFSQYILYPVLAELKGIQGISAIMVFRG
jgi:hypothetical protein